MRFYSTKVWLFLMVVLLAGTNYNVNGVQYGGFDAPYFQSDFTQDLTEWSAALVNPALLYRVNQPHADLLGFYRWGMFTQSEAMGFQHFAFQYPLRRNHTIGGTVLLSRDPIAVTDIDRTTNQIIETGGTSVYQTWWLMGNYGVRVLPWLMLGANLKVKAEHQFEGGWKFSNFPGLDLGVYINPLDHYRFGDIGFSLSATDVVPTQIHWNGVPSASITTSRLRAGVRYAALNDNLVVAAEWLLDNALGKIYQAMNWKDYLDMVMGHDTTLSWKDVTTLASRFGFHVKYMFIPQLWLKGGLTNNIIPYLGFNFNLIYPLPEMINYLNFDCQVGYSFIETLFSGSDKRDERGFTFAGRLSTDFGQTREQKESKRLYDKLILAPMDAYNEAMRLYLAEKYWEASFAFGKVLSLFPNFHLNDRATYLMGNCYRFLYMNDIARQVYKDALEEYTTSEMRSKYLYGLESLDYREGKYDDALKNHAFITNLYPDSDIRPDADYLAGQIHFQLKNYNVAEQLLSAIQPGDPHYLYAQYTLAIINIENEKIQAALDNLNTVINDTTQANSDQLLQDAANTKLGHLFFEMGDKLRNAVEAYQRVPDNSPYQDEALLATSWSWIKVNQPNVALQNIEKMISLYPQSALVPEAFLVKGYALMLLKKYQEAVSALEQCVAACKRTFITQEDLEKRKLSFEQYSTQFAPTADAIKKNALRKPTNKTLEERPEMQKLYDGFAKENKDYFNYTLLAKSHTKFFMREEQILSDAEYALARATRILNSRAANKVLENTKKEEGKIDEELEKLKRELNKIEE